jgi:hypothetical protein
MRKLFATATALTLGLALTTGIRADDKGNDDKGKTDQSNSSQSQTIHGIVAGVTVEGETAVDYQSNKAVMLEAAYLTIVGMPGPGHHGNQANAHQDQNSARADNNTQAQANRDNADRENANRGNANRDEINRETVLRENRANSGRHNVYLVWLSPKTKVCEANNASDKGGEKKECSLDKLEVGDRVEIQMTRRSESSSNSQGTPTEAMRRKHGRNRIYVCDASEITILSAPGHNQDNAHPEAGANASQDNDDKAKKDNDDKDDDNKDKDDK